MSIRSELEDIKLELDRFYDIAMERLANRPDDLAALGRDLKKNAMEWFDRLYELDTPSSAQSTVANDYASYEARRIALIDQWSLAAPYINPLPEKTQAITQSTPDPEPLVTLSALGGTEVEKARPLPLTTGDIAFCFAGLHWKTEKAWKKPLGDKPKWLQACIVIPGTQGTVQTRWNPVLIGASLVKRGCAKPNSVRAKFQTEPLLKPWLEEWKTYEAENFDSN